MPNYSPPDGLLPTRNKSTAIYRCPSDPGRSVIGGKKYLRVRSCSINGYMNGVDVGLVFFNQKGYKVNKKTTEINSPPPAQAFVFLDEHQNSIDDGHFGFAPESDIWMNLPAMWHNNGCDFSFADGHVEAFKWPDARTLAIKVIKFSAHTQQSGLEAAAVSGGDQELIFPIPAIAKWIEKPRRLQ